MGSNEEEEEFKDEFDQLRSSTPKPETEEEFVNMLNEVNRIVTSKPLKTPEISFNAFKRGEYDHAEEEFFLKMNRKGTEDKAPLSERESEIFDEISRNFGK